MAKFNQQIDLFQFRHAGETFPHNSAELANAHILTTVPIHQLQARFLPGLNVATTVDSLGVGMSQLGDMITGANGTLLGFKYQRQR